MPHQGSARDRSSGLLKRAHDGESRTQAATPVVELREVTRRFGDTVAVDAIDLAVRPGEFLSLLGPSGCGKTTTLRLIAGFERPDEGGVLLDGVDMTRTPPHRRDVNTVFQSYALFPHLSVGDNVAYGLRQRRVPKPERRRRVAQMLELVDLPGLEERRPRELSGGQQQRVALARALVLEPRVLLLDEPLGALDLRVRRRLQIELKRIQERVGITFVYVTHDQEEALAMSDRVAVMNAGRIEQLAAPTAIYDHPATRFVAEFIGETNLIRRGGRTIAVRPEQLRVVSGADANGNGVSGEVVTRMVVGPTEQLVVRADDGQELIVRRQRDGAGAALPDSGQRVAVVWPREAALALGADEEEA